jgi:hypothetical protein
VYTIGGRQHVLPLVTLTHPGSLVWVRATGQWIVYRAAGRGGTTRVGVVNLASGGIQAGLGTYPPGDLTAIAVGSHRVALDTPTAALLFTLPETSSASPRLAETYAPSSWPLLARTVEEGYDAGAISVPGLPRTPPRYPGLRSYHLGSFAIPLEAPPGWMVTPPAVKRGVTALQIVNPAHPSEWVAVILNPRGRILSIPPIAKATVAISDVTLAFESPGPGHTVYNGVLYPSVTGGTSEIVVALPNSQHRLAREILDSVGLPY